jgi:hypothetical protein
MACPSLHNIDVVYKFSRQQKKLLAPTTILNTFQKSYVVDAPGCHSMQLRVDRNVREAGPGVDVTNSVSLRMASEKENNLKWRSIPLIYVWVP